MINWDVGNVLQCRTGDKYIICEGADGLYFLCNLHTGKCTSGYISLKRMIDNLIDDSDEFIGGI